MNRLKILAVLAIACFATDSFVINATDTSDQSTTEAQRALNDSKEQKKFTDIPCLTPDGKPTTLSAYLGKGKYVLVDFWASWCAPCRMEAQQTLMPLYEKYKDNDKFMILGIMTADKAENQLKALKTLHYPWQQLIDAETKAPGAFGFKTIPHLILVAPDGTIISRGIRGEEIWKAVEDALK